MTRIEIATQLLVAHINKTTASPITGETIEQALNVADALLQRDRERTDAASAEARKARREAILAPHSGEKSAADLVAELAYGPRPLPTGVPKGGIVAGRRPPNWIERLFSGGGQ